MEEFDSDKNSYKSEEINIFDDSESEDDEKYNEIKRKINTEKSENQFNFKVKN